ncbi:hypothetical protein FRX31_009042 [Thalictrum thalictroides]|uniref:Uncharacterized protein n=1 Tax=Thalictrum thalictroides TaxID=46969 RepID=A0A7J6WVD5_THATH|nr:hypothetical protein FRX31_009042 [Thalictrum thalictroides]
MFQTHMESVGCLRHPNLVPVRAYIEAQEERLIVYDYQKEMVDCSQLPKISEMADCSQLRNDLLSLIGLSKRTGSTRNNIAELQAIRAGLFKALELKFDRIVVDSLFVSI